MKDLIIKDKDGIDHAYEILYVFQGTLYNKNYIVYTDNICNENGNASMYVSIYNEEYDNALESIESDEEWEYVHQVIERLEQHNEFS